MVIVLWVGVRNVLRMWLLSIGVMVVMSEDMVRLRLMVVVLVVVGMSLSRMLNMLRRMFVFMMLLKIYMF